jgi:phage terminase small subunit
MAYTDFTLEKALKRFSLTVEIKELFPEIKPQPLSHALQEQLLEGIPLALRGGSGKARSEFIVAPILLTLLRPLSDCPTSI